MWENGKGTTLANVCCRVIRQQRRNRYVDISAFIGLTPLERALEQVVGQSLPSAIEAGEHDASKSERNSAPHLEENVANKA